MSSKIPFRPVSDQMKFMHDCVNQCNDYYFPQFCVSMWPCFEGLFVSGAWHHCSFIFSSIFPSVFFSWTDHPVNMASQNVCGCLVTGNVLLIIKLKPQITQNGSIPYYKPGHSHFTVLFIISDYAVFIEIILWAVYNYSKWSIVKKGISN